MKRLTAVLSVLIVLTLGLGACSRSTTPEEPRAESPATPSADSTPASPTPTPKKRRPPEVVEVVATGLSVPWGLDFLPDGSALVTERDTARVLLVRPGAVTEVGVVDEADPRVEGGLLGIVVSPDYEDDDTVYIYVTTGSDNRVLRGRYADERLGALEPILTGIPKGHIHDGGRLAFGPDGYLYVSTGDTGETSHSQDPKSLGGKILRITTDGDPAPGNPDPGSPVWSLGHRNVQGLAFDDDGNLWASEFGANTWDELNLIRAGHNYGWPLVEGKGTMAEFDDPHLVWNPADASPSGLAFAEGDLWMASLRGTRLWRIQVKNTGKRVKAVKPKAFFIGDYGRMRAVTPAPDGTLWITTSNRDDRGTPVADDDRIIALRP